jgi:hypothetical protein
MATIMGVQPILTVVLMERQRSWSRMFGLALGLTGLVRLNAMTSGDQPEGGAVVPRT